MDQPVLGQASLRAGGLGGRGVGSRRRFLALALLIVAVGVLALNVLSEMRAGADPTHYDLSLRVRGKFGDGHNLIEFEGKRFDEVVTALEATDPETTPAGDADATLALSPDGFADVDVAFGTVTVSDPATGARLVVVRGRTNDFFDRKADLLATAKWKSDVDIEPELALFYRYDAPDGTALDLSTFEPNSPEIDAKLNLVWVAVSRSPVQGATPEGKPIGVTVDPEEFAAIDSEVEAYFDDGIDDNDDKFAVVPTYIPPSDVPYYDPNVVSHGVTFRSILNPDSPLTDAAAEMGFSRDIRVEGTISLSSIYGETCHGGSTGYSSCTRPSGNQPTETIGLELSAEFKAAGTPTSVPEEVRVEEGWKLTVRGDTAGNVTVKVEGDAVVGAAGEEFNLGGELRFERDTVTGFLSVEVALRAQNLEAGPFTFKLLEGSFTVTKPTDATGAVTTTSSSTSPTTTTTTVPGSGSATGRFTLTAVVDTEPIFGFEGEVSLAVTFARGFWEVSGNVTTEDGSGILGHLMPDVELPLHFDIEDFGFAFTKVTESGGNPGSTTTTSTTIAGNTRPLGPRTEWTFTGSVKIDPLDNGHEFDADFLIMRSQPTPAVGGVAPKPDWLVVVKLGPGAQGTNMRLSDLVDSPPFDFDLPNVFLSYATRVFQQQPEFFSEAVKAFVENQDGRFANQLRYLEGFAARADIKPTEDFKDALEKLFGKEVNGALRLNLFNIAAGPGAWGLELQLPIIQASDNDDGTFRALELKVVGGKIWADVGKDDKVPSAQFGIDGKVTLAVHRAEEATCRDKKHPVNDAECFDQLEFRVALAVSASPTTGFAIQGRGGLTSLEGWHNPFGIKGLTVRSLQVVIGVSIGVPSPEDPSPVPVFTIGLGGGLDIETDANGNGTIEETEKRTVTLAFLLDIQATPPWVIPQGFTFAINRLELRDLATLHNMLVPADRRVNIAGALPDIRLEDVYFAYGAVDEPTLCIRAGFYLAAELHFGTDPNDTPDGAEACNGTGNVPPKNPPTSAQECEASKSCIASVLIDVQIGSTIQTVVNSKVVIQGYFAGAHLGPALKLSPTLVDLSLSANSVHFRMSGGASFHIANFDILSGKFLVDISPTRFELMAEAKLLEDLEGGLVVFGIHGLADFSDFDDPDWEFDVWLESPALEWLAEKITEGFEELGRMVKEFGDDLVEGLNQVGTEVSIGWSRFGSWFEKALGKEPTAGETLNDNWKSLSDMCTKVVSMLDTADDPQLEEFLGFCRSPQEIWEAAIFGAVLVDTTGPIEVPEGTECRDHDDFGRALNLLVGDMDITIETSEEGGRCIAHVVIAWTGFCNLPAGDGHAVCNGGRTPQEVVENLIVPLFATALGSADQPVDLQSSGLEAKATLQALHSSISEGTSAATCATFSYDSATDALSDLSVVLDVDGTTATVGLPTTGGTAGISGQDLFQGGVEALVNGSDPTRTCAQGPEDLATVKNRELFMAYFAEPVTITLRGSDDISGPAVYSIDEGDRLFANGSVADVDAGPVWIDWGDGTNPYTLTIGADGLWSASHLYRDDGTFQVTLDQAESYGSGDSPVGRRVRVTNLAPTSSEQNMVDTAREGDEVWLGARFKDAGVDDTITATVYWGDGTSSSPEVHENTYIEVTHVYADEGSSGESSAVRTVSLVVADDEGASTTYDLDITLFNVTPEPTLTLESSATEGSPVEGELVVTDPGTADWLVVTVDWGDGTKDRMILEPDGTEQRTLPVSHTWVDDDPTGTPSDTQIITIVGFDGDDGRFERTVEVQVANVAPSVSIEAMGAEAATAGDGSTVPVAYEAAETRWLVTVDDLGVLDSHDVSIDWGDGSTSILPIGPAPDGGTTRTAEVTHTWVDDHPTTGTPEDLLTVSVRATDDDTGWSEATAAVLVRNVAPTVAIAPAAGAVDEASPLSWTVTVDDVGVVDTHTVVVDWGDGTTSTVDVPASPDGGTTRTAEVTHTWVDDDPSGSPEDMIIVTATATDDDTGAGSGTGSVTVRNVAPTMSIVPAAGVVDEASPLSWTVTVDDVGVADTHVVTVVWGDGTQATVEVAPTGSITRTAEVIFTPVDDHPSTGTPEDVHTVRVSVVDDDTGSANGADQTVTVRNVAPTITSLDLSATELDENESSVALHVAFADVGVADTHVVTVDWGDGWLAGTGVDADASGADVRTTEVSLPANGSVDRSVTLTNRYGDNGTYTIGVTVRDDDTGQVVGSRTLVVGNVGPTQALDRSSATDTAGGPTWLLQTGQSQSLHNTATDPGSDDLRFDWDFGDGTSTSPWWQWASAGFGSASTDPLPSPQVGPVNPTNTVFHAWAQVCLYGVSTQVSDDDGAITGTEYGAVAVQRAPDGTGPRNFAQWRSAIQNGEISQAQLDCYLDVASHLSSVLLGRSELDDASPGGDPTPWSVANGSVDGTARNGRGVPVVLDEPPGPGGDKLAQEQAKFDRILLAVWLSYADGAFGWNEMVDSGQAFHTFMAEMEAIRRTSADWEAVTNAWQRLNANTGT